MLCKPRSPENLVIDLESLKVETAERYQPSLYNGVRRTKCNKFVEDACELLGVHLPKGLLAREQIAWLFSDAGSKEGWSELKADEAKLAADRGQPVVVCWTNPIPEQSSHIGMLRPKMRLAQAGRSNFSDGSVAQGFGSRVVRYAVHL